MIRLSCNHKRADDHYELLKERIRDRINFIFKHGIKKKSKNIILNNGLKDYLKSLLVGGDLKELITLPPNSFSDYITFLNKKSPSFLNVDDDSNFVLRNVFISSCYDRPVFNKFIFINNIGMDTCPYCNRNYIYSLSKNRSIKPQIDHFYPKSKYPFFGVSYYNLIPSCETCNGLNAKGSLDPVSIGLSNPYLLNAGDFKISYDIKKISTMNPLTDKSSINVKFVKCLPGHNVAFNLDKFYAMHSDHVLELIIKSKLKYAQPYRDYLNSYTGLKFSHSEIDRLILGSYSKDEDIHKRPLAKLYQDIGRELGLLK